MQPYLTILWCCMPVGAYWATVLFCYTMGWDDHAMQDTKRNKPSISEVLQAVISLHVLNILSSIYFDWNVDDTGWSSWNIVLGMIITDTEQYVTHRAQHMIPCLYAYHKIHHEIHSPYSIAAIYHGLFNPAVILDSAVTLSMYALAGLTFKERQFTLLLAYIAVVLDHCQHPLSNGFHWVHHHTNINKNFQAPFFTFWDRVFGTYQAPNNPLIPDPTLRTKLTSLSPSPLSDPSQS